MYAAYNVCEYAWLMNGSYAKMVFLKMYGSNTEWFSKVLEIEHPLESDISVVASPIRMSRANIKLPNAETSRERCSTALIHYVG